MALQLRRKTHESLVYIDKDSAPRIMPNGEDFILEDIPIGTRVIYPNPAIKGLPNREAAIRYAVNHPLEMEPLYAAAVHGCLAGKSEEALIEVKRIRKRRMKRREQPPVERRHTEHPCTAAPMREPRHRLQRLP